MGIHTMLKLLQKKEKGKIVLVKIGNFYIAGGRDAVILNTEIGLKKTCLKQGVCKVGFPVATLEKYTKQIEETEYSYIVYKYIAESAKLEIEKIYKGKKIAIGENERGNCLECKGVSAYLKAEKYIEYMLQLMIKLPRTEKFSIGTEYKKSIYKMLELILYINKIDKKECKELINTLNKIDAHLNTQRIYLRIMKKEKWIDEKKFKVAIEQIYEIGKILGGLIKYYAKNNKK